MPIFNVRGVAKALLACCLAGSFVAVASADQKPTKVRYEEVVRSVLYAPMYVALNNGYFSEAGLDVSLKTAQGTDKGMSALLSGSADIVLIGPEASIYVANSESPVKPKVFSGLTATDGFLLVSREPTNDFSWDKLKGKKVMSFRQGSNPDVFLEYALRKHDLDPKKDVTIVDNVGAAARAGAWMAGQNDYAIFLEPEAGNMEREGYGTVVASIGQEVGQVDFTSFTSTDAYIEKNPDVIETWVNVIARALDYVQTADPADLAQELKDFFPGLSQDEMVATIERYRTLNLWKQDPVVTEAAIDQLQDMLVASNMMKADQRVPYEQVVMMDVAQKVVATKEVAKK